MILGWAMGKITPCSSTVVDKQEVRITSNHLTEQDIVAVPTSKY